MSSCDAFRWQPHPEAEASVRGLVDGFLRRLPRAEQLATEMRQQTGTRFFDWIDHIALPDSPQLRRDMADARYIMAPIAGARQCHIHDGGLFPPILPHKSVVTRVAIKVESAADFMAVRQLEGAIEGEPLAPLRRARVFSSGDDELWIYERHGTREFDFRPWTGPQALQVLRHQEILRRRKREFVEDGDGFNHLEWLLDLAIADLGAHRTCDIFFAAEREYWQRRNRAAQIQKVRQDRLGLGWANHDHHTYRSSRQYFPRLIALLERLRFVCRERFYAGAEAGWGAQVLEQPHAGVIVFADVDLAPDELLADFAHEPLAPRHELGTVGLWCALHGEAILQASMHHLECQFDFNALRDQLCSEGIRSMAPFTDLPYLKQAFTEGERWPVRPDRIDHLLKVGRITPAQAEDFSQHGAIGSHLENLQRDQGYRGFNQQGINQIIAQTDPRRIIRP